MPEQSLKMVKIIISSDQWVLDTNLNRDIFDNFLMKIIGENVDRFADIERTVIQFPRTVTKNQRYLIHRLSIQNEFKANSYDNATEDRIIEITLSFDYVSNLMKDYEWPQEVVIEDINQRTDKQILFNAMIDFIQVNLSNEFNKFLESF